MGEPVSLTLAALSLLDPAIKACRKAYGTYNLTRSFGEHYVSVQRRLEGEKARLEVALETELAFKPGDRLCNQINTELGNLRINFQACQNMIVAIDERVDVSDTLATASQNLASLQHSGRANASRRRFWTRLRFHKKGTGTSSRATGLSSGASSGHQDINSSNTSTPETAISTSVVTPTRIPEALQGDATITAAKQQELTSGHLQDDSTLVARLKWTRQRSAFLKYLDEIHASNDLITNAVTMKVLTGIRDILVVPVFKGTIPTDLVNAQNAMKRLHHALAASNRPLPGGKPLTVCVRILQATAYTQTKKGILRAHDYVFFRENSAVYPIQIESVDGDHATMIVAETKTQGSYSSAPRLHLTSDAPLQSILHDTETDADESLKLIGTIATPKARSPSNFGDVHQLFQDISCFWTIQDNLQALINTEKRYRTYINLAVQISISYTYFTSMNASHIYPRLSDYRYYRPVAHGDDDPRPETIGPESILRPYLGAGFGAKAPKRSTMDIGGSTSYAIFEDQAMTELGILLHQIGCWTVLEEVDAVGVKDILKSKRNDLLLNAGIRYTHVVDLCFASKEEDLEPQARADRIYREVVVPLQGLVDELRWE